LCLSRKTEPQLQISKAAFQRLRRIRRSVDDFISYSLTLSGWLHSETRLRWVTQITTRRYQRNRMLSSVICQKEKKMFARYATATSTMGLASRKIGPAQKPWYLVARSAHRPLSCPLSSNPPRQAGKSSPAVVRLHDHAKTASRRTQAGRNQV